MNRSGGFRIGPVGHSFQTAEESPMRSSKLDGGIIWKRSTPRMSTSGTLLAPKLDGPSRDFYE